MRTSAREHERNSSSVNRNLWSIWIQNLKLEVLRQFSFFSSKIIFEPRTGNPFWFFRNTKNLSNRIVKGHIKNNYQIQSWSWHCARDEYQKGERCSSFIRIISSQIYVTVPKDSHMTEESIALRLISLTNRCTDDVGWFRIVTVLPTVSKYLTGQ